MKYCSMRSIIYLLSTFILWIIRIKAFLKTSITTNDNQIRKLSFTVLNNVNRDNILFYNTLTRKKEVFIPIDPSKISFYSCGPTVYDYAHIGNFRAFLTYDIIKRWLLYCNYDVDHICNLTDVDDKIIIKMLAENKSLREITDKYSKAFFDDLNVLNIIKARAYPKATEHIIDIENMITKLIEKGYAYFENNSVYFKVNSFPTYGQLANLKFDDMIDGLGESGPNIRKGLIEKQSSKDFALWKAASISTTSTQVDSEDVIWDSNFGKGRPGWHIECSAMCYKFLGPTIDIHAGGIDLVFPHHQNEIAQSEAFSEKEFCKYWMHNGFININNEKMSKSLKNFKTLRDIITKPNDARAFRYLIISSQYRNSLNFTPDTFTSAINSLKRIDKLINNLKNIINNSIITNNNNNESNNNDSLLLTNEINDIINININQFELAMCDDLNTPKAVAVLFKFINLIENIIKNKQLNKDQTASILNTMYKMDQVFGLFYEVPVDYFNNLSTTTNNIKANNNNDDVENRLNDLLNTNKSHDINCDCNNNNDNINNVDLLQKLKELAFKRINYKSNKQFKEADIVRDEINSLGYGIKDVKDNQDGYELYLL